MIFQITFENILDAVAFRVQRTYSGKFRLSHRRRVDTTEERHSRRRGLFGSLALVRESFRSLKRVHEIVTPWFVEDDCK